MAGMGHEERFPQTRMSAGCGFRKETIVGMRRNGRDAPLPAVRAAAIKPLESAPSCRWLALKRGERDLPRR
jgi:hypothetical protein